MSQLLTLLDVKSLITSSLSHTRPVGDLELNQAINYGLGKATRAILSVRPQFFLAVVDPFILASGVSEYDVGMLSPPLWRPFRLKVVGDPAHRTVRFKYRSLVDVDFEDKEESAAGIFNEIAYDILEGLLAAPNPPTVTLSTAGSDTVILSSTAGLVPGSVLQIIGGGPPEKLPGTAITIPGLYAGIVAQVVDAFTVKIAPQLTAAVPMGTAATIMRRRVLKIAPAPRESLSGSLYYQTRPPRLVNDTDVLEPVIADHVDVLVHYAMALLKRAVGDTDSRDYFDDAQAQRAELMADLDPASTQDAESLNSSLWGD